MKRQNRRKGPQQLFPTVYESEINRIGLRYTTGHHDGNSPHYLHQRPPHHGIARGKPHSQFLQDFLSEAPCRRGRTPEPPRFLHALPAPAPGCFPRRFPFADFFLADVPDPRFERLPDQLPANRAVHPEWAVASFLRHGFVFALRRVAAIAREHRQSLYNTELRRLSYSKYSRYGGGGGSRTPVRKALRRGAYMLISVRLVRQSRLERARNAPD